MTLNCKLKWQTDRVLNNTHDRKEITYKFAVERTEEIVKGLEVAKGEILEAIEKVLA